MAQDKRKLVGIIAAMDTEIEAIRAMVTDIEEETISGIRYSKGKLYNVDVVVAKCGVGKVFAGICAQTMIIKYNPDLVINVGVGGALTSKLNIGDVAVGDKLVQYDMDTTAVGDPLGLISGINVVYFESDKELVKKAVDTAKELGENCVTGVIASGDRFVSDDATKNLIIDNFDGIVCEMEGAAIAHVCYVNEVPFGVIRTISDNGNGEDYMVCLAKASEVLHKFTDKLIQSF